MNINNVLVHKISCVVPARNEQGRLRSLIGEIKSTNLIDEIIFVEGGSSDETWPLICELSAKEADLIVATQQEGQGKFDAVIKGVRIAKNELVIIWDADGTVNQADTVKIIKEAINTGLPTMGNRLKGSRHPGSMRKLNLVGNVLYALLWSPFLKFKKVDLLCGSKVFRREDFLSIPKVLLKYDPYGDFSLIANALVIHGEIKSIPVDYYARQYGETNINRWTGGIKLLLTSVLCFTWIIKKRIGS